MVMGMLRTSRSFRNKKISPKCNGFFSTKYGTFVIYVRYYLNVNVRYLLRCLCEIVL